MEYSIKAGGGNISIWDGDNTLITDCLTHAAMLLTPATVTFANGKEQSFNQANLCEGYPKYVRRSHLEKTVDLSHIRPGLSDEVIATFKGVVYKLSGDNIRLRLRAYAGHNGESFDLAPGPLKLRCDDLRMRDMVYRKLLHETKELQAKEEGLK